MRKRLVVKWIAVLAFFSFPFLLGAAWAQTETVLYSFCSQHGCTDGLFPEAGLVFDRQGNVYGTTTYGGVSGASCQVGLGCGTIFKLTPDGTETVLYSFCAQSDCTDGALPWGGLALDHEGNPVWNNLQRWEIHRSLLIRRRYRMWRRVQAHSRG